MASCSCPREYTPSVTSVLKSSSNNVSVSVAVGVVYPVPELMRWMSSTENYFNIVINGAHLPYIFQIIMVYLKQSLHSTDAEHECIRHCRQLSR